MAKNVEIAVQLYKAGSVIWLPKVKFPGGVTKAKYAVLLEDADALWKRGRILACLTTSRKFTRFKSWFSHAPASILGKSPKDTTTIDTLNRIHLAHEQILKCRYVGRLSDDQWADVVAAKAYADAHIRRASLPGQ